MGFWKSLGTSGEAWGNIKRKLLPLILQSVLRNQAEIIAADHQADFGEKSGNYFRLIEKSTFGEIKKLILRNQAEIIAADHRGSYLNIKRQLFPLFRCHRQAKQAGKPVLTMPKRIMLCVIKNLTKNEKGELVCRVRQGYHQETN